MNLNSLVTPSLLSVEQFLWAVLPTPSESSWISSVMKADFCSYVVLLSWIFLHSSTLHTCLTLLVRTNSCYPDQNFTVWNSPDLELPLKKEWSELCLSKEEKLSINERKTWDKAYVEECFSVWQTLFSHKFLGQYFRQRLFDDAGCQIIRTSKANIFFRMCYWLDYHV